MKHLLIFLVSLLWAGTCHAKNLAAPKAFVLNKGEILKNRHTTSAVLNVRGGAGPLDPMTVAKVSTAVCLAQAVVMKEAPSYTSEMYGVKSNTGNDFLMKAIGTGIFSLMAACYCLLFQETSYITAFRIGLIPWIVESIGRFFRKDFSSMGLNEGGNTFSLFTVAFMLYAATQDWGTTAMKVFIAFWGAQGIYFAVDPDGGAKAWGKDDMGGSTVMLMRVYGFCLLAAALFQGAMVFYDMDAVTAFGYATLAFLLSNITTLFITGEVDKFGVKRNSIIFWAFFHSVVAGTILL